MSVSYSNRDRDDTPSRMTVAEFVRLCVFSIGFGAVMWLIVAAGMGW